MIRLHIQRIVRALACAIGIAGITACGGGGTPITPSGPSAYAVGGTLVGLSGSGLVLQNNAGDDLAVMAISSSFSFATALATGAAYTVTVKTQPGNPTQVCSVTNGAGTVGSTNVTSVIVTCSGAGFTVGGTVSGLGAGKSVGLRLLADFAAPGVTTVNANGTFTMGVTLAANSEFALIVSAQPTGQTCSVANGAGTVAAANITNVAVTCVNNSASARNWTPAQPLFTDTDPTDNKTVGATSVGYDAAGNAIAVWESSSPTSAGTDTAFSRYTPGAGWTAPALISPFVVPAFGVVEQRLTPRIAVAANGNAVVVWRQRNNTDLGDDVAASVYTVGIGWSPPEIIWATVPGQINGADHLRITIDSSNRVLVVFDASGIVYYRRYSPGAGWLAAGPGSRLSTLAPIFSKSPELAMNNNGQAVAIWEQRSLLDPIIRYDLWSSRYDTGSDTWSAPQPVETDDSGGVFSGKSVVIDAGGTATAVWSQYDGTRGHVYSNRLTGNTWATPTIVETGNNGANGNAYDPRAAIDGNGNVMAIWIQNDVTGGHYVANRYVPGSGWGVQRNIGQYGAVGFEAANTEIALVTNAAGDTVAIWTFYSEIGDENVLGPYHVFANEYNAATGLWGVADIIDAPTGGASLPSLAIDAAGNAVAVWKNNGPTKPGISGSVFR